MGIDINAVAGTELEHEKTTVAIGMARLAPVMAARTEHAVNQRGNYQRA
jgi:hypothetical protein